MATKTQPRTAIYLRISKDPDGTQDATGRQLKDCRAFAKLRDLKITTTFEDVDLSAYRKGVVRPGYEQLLEGIEAGAFDVVLVWRLDRLVRRTVEFARFWTACETHGVQIMSATQPIDSGDPVGKLIIDILVAFAEMESATMSTRIRAKERHMAEQGRHKHAGRRAYGMRDGWAELEPAEAERIRDAAALVLAGESIASIVNGWNAAGIPSPTGKAWTRTSLTVLLKEARLFGKREHHGEIVADGEWPAILDEATGMRLREVLSQHRAPEDRTRRRYLLSGILRCKKCGARMKANTAARGGARYACPSRSDGGCGGTTVLRDAADAAVTAMVLYRLDTPELAAELGRRRARPRADVHTLSTLGDLDKREKELAETWAAGDLSRTAWLAAQRALDTQRDELRKHLATIDRGEPLAAIAGAGNVAQLWEAMSVARQRLVIEALVDRIDVHGNESPWYHERLRTALLEEADEFRAAGRMADARRRERQAESRTGGGGSFRPERLEPVWKF